MFAFALVSMNLIPYSNASWQQENKEENQHRYSDVMINMNKCVPSENLIHPTFSPLSLDTCRLSLTSHLFPRTIRSTSADACYRGITNREKVIVNVNKNALDSCSLLSSLWNINNRKCNTQKCTQNKWIVISAVRGKYIIMIMIIFYLFYVSYPVLDIVKGLLVGNVIH